jgi:hypothetical protein
MDNLNSEKKWSTNDSDARWAERDGIQVNELAENDVLRVATENSTYEMVVVQPETAQVLVRGGRCFPNETLAEVSAASMGSSIKLCGIYVGYAIEFYADGRRVTTSAVRNIRFFRKSELAA